QTARRLGIHSLREVNGERDTEWRRALYNQLHALDRRLGRTAISTWEDVPKDQVEAYARLFDQELADYRAELGQLRAAIAQEYEAIDVDQLRESRNASNSTA